MNPEQSDPNQEREDVPFPTASGPPRYQGIPEMAQPMAQQVQRPQYGNGHAASYQQQTVQPRRAPEVVPPTDLQQRLIMLNAALEVGSLQVASLWAQQLALFQAEYQQRTGRVLSDREAFDLVTMPLMMALE